MFYANTSFFAKVDENLVGWIYSRVREEIKAGTTKGDRLLAEMVASQARTPRFQGNLHGSLEISVGPY